ncbi:hypothetical protein ACGRHY_29120 [Streptomyces sp. HK10]|uniref:hypothetical protein n=1 Tax=Streptomyces sp. HK10 TaxID=3373255 RepID=UPI00374A40F3
MLVQFLFLTLSGIAGGSVAGAFTGDLTPASVISTALGSAVAALAVLYVRIRREKNSQDA